MSNPETPAPAIPEIWYKAKRVIRTVLAVVISLLVTFGTSGAIVAAVAPQILGELAAILPPGAVAWLTAAVAFFVLLSGAVTRIMAIPAVNAWLIRFGAGSVPASAIVTDIAGTFVARDPKVDL